MMLFKGEPNGKIMKILALERSYFATILQERANGPRINSIAMLDWNFELNFFLVVLDVLLWLLLVKHFGQIISLCITIIIGY